MLFSTKATAPQVGPKAIWPYFFVSGASIAGALLAILTIWPWDYPPESALVKIGGDIETIHIYDDISGTGAGWMLPVLTSVYFHFEGIDGEFRYPWTHAKYYYVHDHTGVNADIWVEREALERAAAGDDEPVLIWALEEHNSYKTEDKQTVITYDDMVGHMKLMTASLVEMVQWLTALAFGAALVGVLVRRWNKRNYPDPR